MLNSDVFRIFIISLDQSICVKYKNICYICDRETVKSQLLLIIIIIKIKQVLILVCKYDIKTMILLYWLSKSYVSYLLKKYIFYHRSNLCLVYKNQFYQY